MLVCFVECLGLRHTSFIQIGIHPTPLYDAFQVVIRLAMTDQIDFFTAQFALILAAILVNRVQLFPFLLTINPEARPWGFLEKRQRLKH